MCYLYLLTNMSVDLCQRSLNFHFLQSEDLRLCCWWCYLTILLLFHTALADFHFVAKLVCTHHFQRTNYLLSLKFHQEDIYFWSNLLRKKKSQNKTFFSVDMQPTTSFRDTLIWHPRLLRNILKTLRLCSASTGLTLVCCRMGSLKNYLNSVEVTCEGDFF